MLENVHPVDWLVTFALIVTSLGWVFVRALGVAVRWYEPLILFCLSVTVWTGAKYLYITATYGPEPTYLVGAVANGSFTLLVLMAYVATLFTLQMRRGPRTRERAPAAGVLARREQLRYWLLVTIAIAITLVALIATLTIAGEIAGELVSAKRFGDSDLGPQARLGTSKYLLFRLAMTARISAALTLMLFFLVPRGRRRQRLLVAALLFVNFAMIALVTAAFSNRAGLLLLVLDLLVIAAAFGGLKIFNIKAMVLAGATVSVMILISSMRSAHGAGRSVMEHIFDGRSFADVERTGRIVDYYQRSGDYLGGQSFVDWVFLLLPDVAPERVARFLNMGWETGYQVFGYASSGVSPGFIAEAFMNFGWPGIIVGALLFGVAAAWWHLLLTRRGGLSTPMLVFVCLAGIRLGLFLFNNSFGTFALKTLSEVLPVVVIVWLCIRTPRRAPAAVAYPGLSRAH
jgi:oligosaccharide repeat unit polymerase